MRKRIQWIIFTFHGMFKMEVHGLVRDYQNCPLFRKISLIINFRLYFNIVPCWVKNLKVICSLQQYTNIFDLCIQACAYMHTSIVSSIANWKTEGEVKTLKIVLNVHFKQKNSLSSCCYSLKNTIHSSEKKCCSLLDVQENFFVGNRIDLRQKEKVYSEEKWWRHRQGLQ